LAAKIILLFVLIIWLVNWRSSDLNYPLLQISTQALHSNEKKSHFILGADSSNNFNIALVENSKQDSANPYFPSIHIQASQPHNAWIHIVYTDSKAPEWRVFIDAAKV
jgi:hypothetical protein